MRQVYAWLLLVLSGCVGPGATCEEVDWYLDADGDGYGASTSEAFCEGETPSGYVLDGGDCDDFDPRVAPGAVEACNGVDDDCDTVIDEDVQATGMYADADGDGFGDPNDPVASCTEAPGVVGNDTDCDDSLGSTHPGAAEVCDGVDNDCDGQVDEGATDGTLWFEDHDDDGFGAGDGLSSCSPLDGRTSVDGDCDDDDPTVFPGAEEVCDLADNDCNDLVDDGATDAAAWYADDDGDGYGDDADRTFACTPPSGRVAVGGDCDDSDPSVHPESWWYSDGDGDGVGAVASGAVQQCSQPAGYEASSDDCDDTDATAYPGAIEWCDSVDNDCNGVVDDNATDATEYFVDADGDGYGAPGLSLWACADPGPSYADNDADCDDTRSEVNPDHAEVCDGEDNDCDGLIDIDDPGLTEVPTWYPDEDGDGAGAWAGGVWSCDPLSGYVLDGTDCDDTDGEIYIGAIELCDGVDNDCDALVDGADAVDSDPWFSDFDGDGWGDPATGSWQCEGLSGQVLDGTDCDDTDPAVHPLAAEPCDATRDLNCDGSFGFSDLDGDGFVACEDCNDAEPLAYPGAVEVCDEADNDCNGLVDDDGLGGYPWRWFVDDDNDGYGLSWDYITWCEPSSPPGYSQVGGDCEDEDSAVHPFAPEVCNLIDDDCDGVIPPEEVDLDGDGQTPVSCGGTDCDDSQPLVFLGAEEVCGDGIDNDCDGVERTCWAEHLSEPFFPTTSTGQWCYSDAPVHWAYFGEIPFRECQELANATGTQWYVGQYTSYTRGWIGDHGGGRATRTDPLIWSTEVVESADLLNSCVLGQVEERTAPTVSPAERVYTDADGRVWHYWEINDQTHSQAMSFADVRGARIINPNSVGLDGQRYMTAPTHWCHAGAEYNGASSCNSDNRCDFIVGYWE